ncbi:MAG: hypothetical protein ACFB4I_11290 [Cyanophyceae cyanobacterium]
MRFAFIKIAKSKNKMTVQLLKENVLSALSLFTKFKLLVQSPQVFFLGIIVLQCIGCSKFSNTTQATIIDPATAKDECSDKPGELSPAQVEEVNVDSQSTTISAQIISGKDLGYIFEGKEKQKLSCNTENELCIWIYNQRNEMLDSVELPENGKYIIQVSVPRGSTTFKLSLAIEDAQAPSFSEQVPSTTSLTNYKEIEERPAADEFIVEYYKKLNDRDYKPTWEKLSFKFQRKLPSYSKYKEWWNSVKEIKIGKVTLIAQSHTTAVVNAELWYVMNNNTVFEDYKSRIYLVWSKERDSWLINKNI